MTHTAQQLQDALLRRVEVEKQTALSRSTIYRLMSQGKFPKSLSLGTGSVRWKQSDISAWLASLSVSQ